MKPKTISIALVLLLALVQWSCTADESLVPDNSQSAQSGIQLIIPDSKPGWGAPSATRVATDPDGNNARWEEGDAVYFTILYLDEYDNTIGDAILNTALYTPGGWQLMDPIIPPDGTDWLIIDAFHATGDDILHSHTSGTPQDDTLTLPSFSHLNCRLTFTGLEHGDELKLTDQWRQLYINNNNLADRPTTTYTAPDDGAITLYACFGVTIPHTFTVNGIPGTFTPAAEYELNTAYTIPCHQMTKPGGEDPGEIALKAKIAAHRADFLDWAQDPGNRWRTEDFTLLYDLDLSDVENWVPIGTYSFYFGKTFDGGGHTITGLEVIRPGEDFNGMFGYIGQTGKVQNLILQSPEIQGDKYSGAIAGINHGYIEACVVTGGNITASQSSGGIAGSITATGIVSACQVSGVHIAATEKITGGICYSGFPNVKITASIVTGGSITAPGLIGGVGEVNTINACYWLDDIYFASRSPEDAQYRISALTQTEIDDMNAALDNMSSPWQWVLEDGQARVQKKP